MPYCPGINTKDRRLTNTARCAQSIVTAATLRATVARIRDLVTLKLDAATAAFVQHYDKHTNRKDNTCQLTVALPGVQLGIWVNAAKNLRLKLIEHPAMGVVTDIPRPIMLQVPHARRLPAAGTLRRKAMPPRCENAGS